jgi:hypothetical protein
MALAFVPIRVKTVSRDINVFLNDALGVAARQKILADFAKEQIDETQAKNSQILGHPAKYTISVDGRINAPIKSVQRTVVAEWSLLLDALTWIADQLVTFSPKKTARYSKSHILFADGQEVDAGQEVPEAQEYVFLNAQPYARKIERGSSSQAPDGVYQVVAVLAARKFGNSAKVSFTYRTPIGGQIVGGHKGNRSDGRQPAIVVTSR